MRKKIAITFPQLHEFGGGEIFCEYICNLLQRNYQIDLYFYKNNKINKNIRFDKNIKLIGLKSKSKITNFFCSKFIFLAQIYLIYYLDKKINNAPYCFIFSGAGEFISKNYKVYQYIHHPFYSLNPKFYLALGVKFYEIHKIAARFIVSLFVRIYFYLNKEFFNKNTTFVNSNWTKKRYFKIYKKNSKIIYPTFSTVNQKKINYFSFNKKKNNFLILGRVGNDKKTFDCLKFLVKFKKKYKHFNIGKLLIIGPIKFKLKRKVDSLQKKYINDVRFYGHVSYKERDKILNTNKYGLHFCREEHFGRSILEMKKKGVIVFCHNSGGAKEIISSKFQRFENMNDLEKLILKVLKSKNLRKNLILQNFNNNLDKFSENEFVRNLTTSLQ